MGINGIVGEAGGAAGAATGGPAEGGKLLVGCQGNGAAAAASSRLSAGVVPCGGEAGGMQAAKVEGAGCTGAVQHVLPGQLHGHQLQEDALKHVGVAGAGQQGAKRAELEEVEQWELNSPGVLGLPSCVGAHLMQHLDADGIRVARLVCRWAQGAACLCMRSSGNGLNGALSQKKKAPGRRVKKK